MAYWEHQSQFRLEKGISFEEAWMKLKEAEARIAELENKLAAIARIARKGDE
jgi:hypothetical protein